MNGIINLNFNCNILLQSHDIGIGYLHTNKIIRIFVNFVIHVLKWELWKIRNLVKHENQTFTRDQVFNIIVLKIVNATRFIEMTRIKKSVERL